METLRAVKKGCCKARYLVSFLAFLGLVNLFAICISMSITMVAMVNDSLEKVKGNHSICPQLVGEYNVSEGDGVVGIPSQGEFSWDFSEQGYLLSAYFYGYFFSSISAGLISTTYGAKWVLGFGVLIAGVFTLFVPLIVRWSYWGFFVFRLIVGLGSGVCLPTIHTLIGKWVPEKERSIQNTLIFNGITTGNVLTLTTAGHLIKSGFLGGWPAVFYITGALSCTWFIFWAYFVYESPLDHPRITQEELDIIMGGMEPVSHKSEIPWKAIATCVPFQGLCVTHFCNNWGFSTLLAYVPTYLSQVLHIKLRENGLLSAIPYIASFVFASFSCVIVDKVRSLQIMPITTLRKLANSVAFFLPGLCMITLPLIGCKPIPIITLLALTSGFNGFKFSGFCVTHVDMSPEFAGLLMSGTSAFGNFAGMMAPLYTSTIQKQYPVMDSWTIIFITAGVIYITGGIVYNLFCSAKLQPWGVNAPSSQEDTDNSTEPDIITDNCTEPHRDTENADSENTNHSEEYKNSESKISDDNDNSESKISDDNDNSESKISDVIDNSESKISDDNDNSESKISDGNDNSESKISDDNDNSESKISDENDNSESKISDDNDNSESKISDDIDNSESSKDFEKNSYDAGSWTDTKDSKKMEESNDTEARDQISSR